MGTSTMSAASAACFDEAHRLLTHGHSQPTNPSMEGS
jgi:hypothetical protein